MAKPKKKFGDTTVGKILGTGLGLINPALGGLVQGTNTVEDLLAAITAAPTTPEDEARAKAMVLDAYEAEVNDRIAARDREAAVALAGGNDLLFKTIGWTIAASFFAVVLYGLGIIPAPEEVDRDFLMFASGSVTSAFMAVVSYYFGSSMGSKAKQVIIDNASK